MMLLNSTQVDHKFLPENKEALGTLVTNTKSTNLVRETTNSTREIKLRVLSTLLSAQENRLLGLAQ